MNIWYPCLGVALASVLWICPNIICVINECLTFSVQVNINYKTWLMHMWYQYIELNIMIMVILNIYSGWNSSISVSTCREVESIWGWGHPFKVFMTDSLFTRFVKLEKCADSRWCVSLLNLFCWMMTLNLSGFYSIIANRTVVLWPVWMYPQKPWTMEQAFTPFWVQGEIFYSTHWRWECDEHNIKYWS